MFGYHRLVVAAAVVLGSVCNARAADPVTFPRAAGAVVVRLTETIGELALDDGGPSLTVYGDGRAVAQYPRNMKRAGTHTIRLTTAELTALVQSLAGRGLLAFDPTGVRRARDEARTRRAAADTTVVSDVDLTVIEVTANQQTHRVTWTGVREDARQFPEIAELQNLAGARSELTAIMDRAHAQSR